MEMNEKYLLLHGGVDIDPKYYGEKPHPMAQNPSIGRDAKEFTATKLAFKNKIPVIGICRGAQLLCIANGGKLYQHSDEHHQGHALETFNKLKIKTHPAMHHQIMRLEGTEHEVLAWAPFPTTAFDGEGNRYELEKSPEVVYFPKTNSLGIQGHPEWDHPSSEFRQFVDRIIFEKVGLKDIF